MRTSTKIQMMRIADQWIGIPICFLLSCARLLLSSFKAKREGPPRKILIIKLSEMGALILSYSLLRNLQTRFPDAKVHLLTFERNKSLVPFLGDVLDEKDLITICEDSLFAFIGGLFKAVYKIHRQKFDIVLDLEFFARISAIFAYLSGAPKRVGLYAYGFEGLYRGNLFTHKVQHNPLLHVSKLYFSFAQALDEDRKASPELNAPIPDEELVNPCYVSQPSVRQDMAACLSELGITRNEKLVLISPGEGMLPLREWSLENFITLSRHILEDANTRIIIVSEENPQKKDELLRKAVNDERCFNFTGKTTLPELLELFCMADLMIINDCGLAHLASLTPLRTIIFFGPESPQIFAPLGDQHKIFYSQFPCSPCLSALNHRQSFCQDNRCLKAINEEEVTSTAKEILK